MRWAGLVILIATCLAPSWAIAQVPGQTQDDPTTDAFKQHMRVGVDLYNQRNYVAAIAEFDEAYKLKPKASPLVNKALCHKAQFAYPKAIAALETALDKHADTMTDDEKKAAQREIDEMRALLVHVTFKVTPSSASVQVDGDTYPDAVTGKPVPLSPGPHSIRVTAEGFTSEEQALSLASGSRELTYSLKPNMGFIRIRAGGPKYAIAIDQKALSYGEWSGLLAPGPHVLEMYIPGSAAPPYRVRVDIEVGKSYEVSPGKGGVPILGGGGSSGTQTPKPQQPPDKPVKGPFALATVALFGPTEQPAAFSGEGVSPGVSVGLRLGYRVNTPVSFDAMFEYSNILIEKKNDENINYNLEMVRGGLNMRLQTPGKIARFYGDIGGGFVYEALDFSYTGATIDECEQPLDSTDLTTTPTCKDIDGFDGYFLIGAGLQFSFGGVLVDAGIATYLQSTRGFLTGRYRDWLPIFQGGLKVGYSLW